MKKKLVYIFAIVGIIAGCFGFFAWRVHSVNLNKYNKAVELINTEEYENAISVLDEIPDFKDSSLLRDKCNYSIAQNLLAQGDDKNAYRRLLDANMYSDTASLLEDLEKKEPLYKLFSLSVGDTFEYGSYEQDNNSSNGKEPIEWVLLNKNNDNFYAISKFVLDAHCFNETNEWSASIYDWLNHSFADEAFTQDERTGLSRICLLKSSEIKAEENETPFVDIDLKAEFTPYAKSKDQLVGYATGYSYWYEGECESAAACRSSGDYLQNVVTESGATNYVYDVYETAGVRPTIWILTDEKYLPKEVVYDGSKSESTYTSTETSGGSSTVMTDMCQICHKRKATHGIYCDDCYYDNVMDLYEKGVSPTELEMWANGYSEYDDDYASWYWE